MKVKLIAALIASAVLTATALVSSTVNARADVSTKGGLKVSSGDDTFVFGGRIMYDYNKAAENGITDEEGFNLRRGRVYAKGNVAENWAFKTQFNINGDGVEDVYLRYTGWGKVANFTIGNQKMPFGLEELTSSKGISVLEPSAITERYAVGRVAGVQLHGAKGHSTYGIGIFTDDVNAEEEDEETGFAARYTFAPVKTDASVIHVGIAYKDIEDDNALGFEAAVAFGPLHIQAEYVAGEEGAANDLSGYYVQAGYILTGESRPYKAGKFKRVKPEGAGGAWELVARYEEGDGNHNDIELGATDASAYTLGLNWYAHDNVRLGVNYTDGEDNTNDDEGNEFRVRFQLTF